MSPRGQSFLFAFNRFAQGRSFRYDDGIPMNAPDQMVTGFRPFGAREKTFCRVDRETTSAIDPLLAAGSWLAFGGSPCVAPPTETAVLVGRWGYFCGGVTCRSGLAV